jgi:hypothetical protein
MRANLCFTACLQVHEKIKEVKVFHNLELLKHAWFSGIPKPRKKSGETIIEYYQT